MFGSSQMYSPPVHYKSESPEYSVHLILCFLVHSYSQLNSEVDPLHMVESGTLQKTSSHTVDL